jgi:hypothetical protein
MLRPRPGGGMSGVPKLAALERARRFLGAFAR